MVGWTDREILIYKLWPEWASPSSPSCGVLPIGEVFALKTDLVGVALRILMHAGLQRRGARINRSWLRVCEVGQVLSLRVVIRRRWYRRAPCVISGLQAAHTFHGACAACFDRLIAAIAAMHAHTRKSGLGTVDCGQHSNRRVYKRSTGRLEQEPFSIQQGRCRLNSLSFYEDGW